YTELTVKHPLIDLRLFKDRNFALANLVIFIFGIGMFGTPYLIPLFLQNCLGYTAFQSGLFFVPVGFIQGIVSPSVGALSQKYNPKIFIILGLLIMSSSFFVYNYLSYFSEEWYIMLGLYLRGMGLGMLFTPLLAVALKDISQNDMAQASSTINILRQVGGSIGVALFSHILSVRNTFHTQRYGEALDYTGQTYRDVLAHLSQFLQHTAGVAPHDLVMMSERLVLQRVDLEGYISGITDDFFIAFLLILAGVIPALWLKTKKKKKSS
ncbi:MAG: MFS transporter, partial [Bacteroidales bacterium]|nr:MFS transporter [Bacteroidales bacterium]